MKRNLVLVRAGDTSLHPTWLVPETERNWDLVVSYYGDDPEIHKDGCLARFDRKGTEFPAFHEILAGGGLDWSGYEHIWLPDDDLAVDGRSIDRFFELCSVHRLALAQPSLDPASHISFPITLRNPRFILRWTNFVEIMAPCFQRNALLACLDTFVRTQSGWGLDFLWAARIGGDRRIAIVDEVSIRHTRPVGGPLYGLLDSMGVDVQVEHRECLLELAVDRAVPRIHAGLTKSGKIVTFESRAPGVGEVLRLLLRGEPVAAHIARERMRGTGRRDVRTFLVDQVFHTLGYPERWLRPRTALPPSGPAAN
ncbi:MAG TPA: DUF707 domain-containing protein [Fibrobacteria bacterium]|nr:DUF707 domain-containing protein [Fibrobacteria bacterium]